MKVCNECKLEKSLDQFHNRQKSADGKQKKCKACQKAIKKQWEQENRDKKNEYDRRSYAKHAEKRRASNKQWRLGNAERKKETDRAWQKENRDKCNTKNREWAKRNHDYIIAKTARRRADKLKATPEWANMFFVQEVYRLALLRSEVLGFKWVVDHIVPLISDTVCGLHCEANLRVIPEKDNLSKGNRWWPDMWEPLK